MVAKDAGVLAAIAVLPASGPMLDPPVPPTLVTLSPPPEPPDPPASDVRTPGVELQANGNTHIQGTSRWSQVARFFDRCVGEMGAGFVGI